jgi:hypothetical protein
VLAEKGYHSCEERTTLVARLNEDLWVKLADADDWVVQNAPIAACATVMSKSQKCKGQNIATLFANKYAGTNQAAEYAASVSLHS